MPGTAAEPRAARKGQEMGVGEGRGGDPEQGAPCNAMRPWRRASSTAKYRRNMRHHTALPKIPRVLAAGARSVGREERWN